MFLAPDAVKVTTKDDYTIRVEFENGEIRDFNVREQCGNIALYGRLFEDQVFFEKAHIEYGAVTWNEQIDIAPEWLYADSVPVAEMG